MTGTHFDLLHPSEIEYQHVLARLWPPKGWSGYLYAERWEWYNSQEIGHLGHECMTVLRTRPIAVLLGRPRDEEKSFAVVQRMIEMNMRFEPWSSIRLNGGGLGFFFTTKADATLFALLWGSM